THVGSCDPVKDQKRSVIVAADRQTLRALRARGLRGTRSSHNDNKNGSVPLAGFAEPFVTHSSMRGSCRMRKANSVPAHNTLPFSAKANEISHACIGSCRKLR